MHTRRQPYNVHANIWLCALLACAYIYDYVDTHKHVHVPAVYFFLNFENIDHFLCLLLAQRLLPLPISHLSLISLGMSVCVHNSVLLFVCAYVCGT